MDRFIKNRGWIALFGLLFCFSGYVMAEGKDTVASPRFIHRLGLDGRPAYIFPTNRFLKGENEQMKIMRQSASAHLKYSFQFHPSTITGQVYGDAYQGLGLAYYRFGNTKELGNPFAFYLFQGARLKQITTQLSFNYEWNFGLSAGWKPFDQYDNHYNRVIGSKINAYMNVDFYLNWMLSRHIDLTTGFSLSHFSNGNTKYPNSGLNTVGLRVGLTYNFNRDYTSLRKAVQLPVSEFPQHISYDLVLFGAWRKKGLLIGEEAIGLPKSFTVLGFNFSPMYNVGYKFRVGASLDGFYDSSANVYIEDYITELKAHHSVEMTEPSLSEQLALGVSARAEYVMPYFTVGIGLGVNVLHGGGDLKAFYQIIALKAELTRNSFLHIGYSLHDFHSPNFLMLGIGYRFNNKYPFFHR